MNSILRVCTIAVLGALAVSSCSGGRGVNGSALLPPTASTAAMSSSDSSASVAPVPQVAFEDRGEARSTAPIAVAVTLSYRHQDQLDALVARQSDVASSDFKHWLTPAEFAAEFGPARSGYDRVRRALEAGGFHITRTYSNLTVIDATGTVSDVERFFHTAIHRVDQAGRIGRYVNVRPAIVPNALRGLVYAVNGLSNVAVVKFDHVPVPYHRSGRRPTGKRPYMGPVSSTTGFQGYGPRIFAQSYDMPAQHATAGNRYDGSGRAGAIVIDADFRDGDLHSYLKYFGIKRTGKIRRVAVDGGVTADPGLSNDSIETTLDVEVLAGEAPGADIYVYETAPFGWGNPVITDAYNAIVSKNKVDTVNSSFGLCELGDPSAAKAWNHVAEQGAALGITFHASSGDSGSNCSGGGVGVDAPASDTYFVGIGGTSLKVDQKNGYAYTSETAWDGSGGGISSLFTMPSWQKSVTGAISTGRNVPDLAFDADPLTGFPLYLADTWNTPWNPVGGTSLASPIFGASLLQMEGVIGTRLGLAAPRLVGLWQKKGYTSGATTYFHDVTAGSNGLFTATTGYDRVTGIGSFDGWPVAQALKP